MTDPNVINAIVRDMDDPRYPALLGVSCDGDDSDGDCGAVAEADFVVHEDDSKPTRLGYVLDYAARNGWTVVGRHRAGIALTYCPDHKHLARPVVVPGNAELVGTRFPGQMPQATWDELMAWYFTNGFDPNKSPSTRDVVIGATLDRWEAVGVDGNGDPSYFGEGPTRSTGVMLREGEEWSHEFPGREGSARVVRFVSTPVTVPLPQHLRTAIEKAAAEVDLPDGMRTPVEWCAQYAVAVTNRIGWTDSKSWHDPIREEEFVTRCKAGDFHQIPLTDEQASVQLLADLLTGKVALDGEPETKA